MNEILNIRGGKLNAIDKQNLDGVYGATAVALDWPGNLSEKAKKALDYKDGLTIIGGRNGQGEPWRISTFDDEDEAPLIDVPEGSDEPDYGPEKIPPRKE